MVHMIRKGPAKCVSNPQSLLAEQFEKRTAFTSRSKTGEIRDQRLSWPDVNAIIAVRAETRSQFDVWVGG